MFGVDAIACEGCVCVCVCGGGCKGEELGWRSKGGEDEMRGV